ncbi:MAG: TlyA family RNA methyltransferase [Desulfobacteraceae bacterium]|nr:TlyA family RNA methyltransferase [Desulfobacteraceae bacterium]MBC2755847.1 TlyA family RNA methyltransferase [Desulfobacteraceae bacterium]
MAAQKKRLDVLVFDKGLANSRQRASALIMAGSILVNNQPVDKPGSMVSVDAEIMNKGSDIPFVSRGGFKIEKAIESLNLDVTGMLCLDVGASTGGFTDCLLQHGASRVYAIDVGYGQLDWKLRQDPRVVVIERTNIRYATEELLPEPFDLISIDVSFISLKIVIPAVKKFLKNDGKILALIKPQFEVGKNQVGKGGVVKDPKLHQSVIEKLSSFFSDTGFKIGPVIPSPILGPKGNKEFIIYLMNQLSLWG